MANRLERAAERVSPVELLFDLVFVFTITQVTEVVVHPGGWVGVGQAALTLAIVYWMYDGFAWLTNQAGGSGTVLRLGLVVAMIAFLLLAVAIPQALGERALLFGVAYLVIVLLHSGLFGAAATRQASRAILRVMPFNVGGALVLVAAAFVPEPWRWAMFLLAVAVFLSSTFWHASRGFDVGGSHFVERHGLLMIIAFGEAIVSVGVGAAGVGVSADVIVAIVLCVGVVAAMWWCYFSGDADRADETMTTAATRRRSTLALTAFGFDHVVMIFGLVLFAAGVRLSIDDVFATATPQVAWLLASGVGLYLLGDARYRQELALGPALWRYVGAVACALTGLLASVVPVAVQLGVLLVLLILVVSIGNLTSLPGPPRRRRA
ncbi:low temperature requirement protein A [Leifsonia sp. Root112D2]|jgi:low temperature requirement protein LtrA|uniref:low temperature requirement protein A n=1 Tax=Leifsonia sp. Root112D2 TaxID=1736426 RepID=UPI0006F3481C|nr:low temperature requirement protein A [Leifsonia sp. Root112D2]KQV06964.1 hypothetical protein ASC63_06335 [Leifsonia sp. Root112D2]